MALLGLLLAFVMVAVVTTQAARATTVSPGSLGVNLRLVTVNHQLQPGDLSVASANGLGVARVPVNQGSSIDAVVRLTAAAHLRLYPELGLRTAETPAAAAGDMAQFVTSFAGRYGPGGSFWSENPQLPYLPVQSFEIGNEPNMPLQWVADTTNLHWTDPSAYAQVYEASRAALHQVDPSGVAVVGGLGDSASGGVDLQSDQKWLSALTPGAVDAVGYHPYTYDVSNALTQTDTAKLREWMDANNFAAVPLDVNEFDACAIASGTTNSWQCSRSQTSAEWGAVVASYTQWALCTPSLNVENVQPFYWGSTATTDADVWMALVTGEQALTPLGQDYLGQAKSLTGSGCPALLAQAMSAPTIAGASTSGVRLSASAGWWTGNPTPTLSYQWERCAGTGQSCADIAGATSAGYTLQPAEIGSTIRVAVTAGNVAGTATASSSPTALVGGGQRPTVTTPPASSTKSPRATTVTTKRAKRTRLSKTRLRVIRIMRRGRHLDVSIRHDSGCYGVRVIVYSRRGHRGHRVRLRLISHHPSRALTEFTAKLTPGRWMVVVSARAASGHTAPDRVERQITILA